MILELKLQDIRNKLLILLDFFKKICAIKIKDIPSQIDKIVVGKSKVNSYLLKNISVVEEDDLKYVINIPLYAFIDCQSLSSVTIPSSVTFIGYKAFYGCTSLENVYVKSTTPPSLNGSVFTSSPIIHVPVGSEDAYKSATNWSNYASRIVGDIVVE